MNTQRLKKDQYKQPAKKIVFVIGSLAIGGAQRALVHLANSFYDSKWHVTILALSTHKVEIAGIHSAINVKTAPNLRGFKALKWLAHHFKKINPDVIHAYNFETNILVALTQKGLNRSSRAQIIWRLSSNYTRMLKERPTRSRFIFQAAMAVLWRYTDYVVAPSHDAATDFGKVFPGLTGRVGTIPNIVIRPSAPAPQTLTSAPLFVSAGRIEYAKNFTFMLEAFSAIPEHYNAHLAILGDGSLRDDLINQAKERGVSQRLHLPGHVDYPANYYDNALAYLLTSRREGFPNAMAEAMAFGLPVISVDCRSGPRELVQGGTFGHLTPEGDVESFTKAMIEVIENGGKEPNIGALQFSQKNIMALYQSMLDEFSLAA